MSATRTPMHVMSHHYRMQGSWDPILKRYNTKALRSRRNLHAPDIKASACRVDPACCKSWQGHDAS